MKLLEYKGKEILAGCGVRSAPGIVTDNKSYINLSFHKERYKEFFLDHKKVIIKAQIAAIHRKQNGYIIEADNYKESLKLIEGLYDSESSNASFRLRVENDPDLKSGKDSDECLRISDFLPNGVSHIPDRK